MTPESKPPVLRLHNAGAGPSPGVSRAGNTGRGGAPGPRATGPARRSALRPALRLSEEAAARTDASLALARARQVEQENRLASGMSPADARWVFARRVAEQLEGGVAAILTPEKRRRLLATARRVGLRDFDASLVIALVQDGRRSGKGGLNPEVERSLTLIRPADRPRGAPEWVRFAIAAAIMGAIMTWMLTRWITG
ncbi:MAG: hypothetical protein AB7K52_00400 [Phycisphaerales bacterium]